jgi:hypothetical protein
LTLSQEPRQNFGHPISSRDPGGSRHDRAGGHAQSIADPAAATSSLLDRWVEDCENYPMTDAVAGYAGRTQFAADKAARWPAADHEWTARAG